MCIVTQPLNRAATLLEHFAVFVATGGDMDVQGAENNTAERHVQKHTEVNSSQRFC
jgi:hypothetical protein